MSTPTPAAPVSFVTTVKNFVVAHKTASIAVAAVVAAFAVYFFVL